MKITANILVDFFRSKGWTARRPAAARSRAYDGVRLYYSGCALKPGYLYVLDAGQPPESLPDCPGADFCLLDGPEGRAEHPLAYVVLAPCGLTAFYSAVQELFERLFQWDQTLSGLLLSGGTLQDILDCSAEILVNPCFFQDDQFYVLASLGQIAREDNPYFHDTIASGRSPNRFFEELLTLPQPIQASYTPRDSVHVAQQFSKSGELMANCMVDGVPVLRFCMACTLEKGAGIRDVVSHLMGRIRTSAGIRSRAAGSFNAYDCLFARIIDDPADPATADAVATLGLHKHALFSIVAIQFGAQVAALSSIRAKLQVLHPGIRFFLYQSALYALVGNSRKDVSPETDLEHLHGLLFERLEQMGAAYGVSHPFPSVHDLGAACKQAAYVLSAADLPQRFARYIGQNTGGSSRPERQRPRYYQQVMPAHILSTFFERHPFDCYCPRAFRRMMDDVERSGVSSVQLLFTYLSHECNATATARLLHMHRNNVIYRINKLQEKYRFQLDDEAQRLLLLLLCLAAGYGCGQ